MKEKIKCWLIQRCSRQLFPREKPGFDAEFSCDYMGSAEFEFGSLPESLRAICANLDSYELWSTKIKSAWVEPVFIYGPKKDRKEITDAYRAAFLSPRPFLKERTMFYQNLGLEDPHDRFSKPLRARDTSNRIVLWWDIVNNFFVVCGADVATKLTTALSALRERWVAEGKIECPKKLATATKRSSSRQRSKKSSTPQA